MLLLIFLHCSLALKLTGIVFYFLVMVEHVCIVVVAIRIAGLLGAPLSLFHHGLLDWVVILNDSIVIAWLHVGAVEKMFDHAALIILE